MLCPACGLECKCGAAEVVLVNTTKIEHCNSIFCHNLFNSFFFIIIAQPRISKSQMCLMHKHKLIIYAALTSDTYVYRQGCVTVTTSSTCSPPAPSWCLPQTGRKTCSVLTTSPSGTSSRSSGPTLPPQGMGTVWSQWPVLVKKFPQSDYINATGRNRFISILIQMLLYSQIREKYISFILSQ